MPSHGHGQGYADTHFLIPETIERGRRPQGPVRRAVRRLLHRRRDGARHDRQDRRRRPCGSRAACRSPARRRSSSTTAASSAWRAREIRDNDDDKSLIAVQIADTDGPFDNQQEFRQGNALVKWQGKVGTGDLKLETNWYSAKWNAVRPGARVGGDAGLHRSVRLARSERGRRHRRARAASSATRCATTTAATGARRAYLVQYDFRLYSNFTLFARDPVHGDEIEQDDVAHDVGPRYALRAALRRWLDMDSIVTVGAQLRNDDVENGAVARREARAARRVLREGDEPVQPHATTASATSARTPRRTIHLLPHVHVLPGVRVRAVHVGRRRSRSGDARPIRPPTTGGTRRQGMVLPEAVGRGRGHDEARRVRERRQRLSLERRAQRRRERRRRRARPRARRGGRRAHDARSRTRASSADVWYLHLDSELVWSGDEGGTEPSGPTRRYGVDLEARVQSACRGCGSTRTSASRTPRSSRITATAARSHSRRS